MKKSFFFALIFSLNFVFGQTPSNDPHWQLKWEENFDNIDPIKWTKANHCDHGGEPTLFQDENIYTLHGSGVLVIKIDNNGTYCQTDPTQITSWACGDCQTGYHPYTSGWLETSGSFNTQFGYIEARIKFPPGAAFHHGFWTFRGTGVPTSNECEIDIAEPLGSDPNVVGTNLHLAYGTPTCPQPEYPSNLFVPSYASGYHIYGVEWSPSRIIWYIDNYPVRLAINPGIVDPVIIILGTGIDKFATSAQIANTSFPSYMYVDYVRVYTLNEDCTDFINATNYDFSIYNNVEKNFIRIGEGEGNNSLSPGDNITLRASQYILIDGNFYVPVGASLYMDANNDCSFDLGRECMLFFNPCSYDFVNYDNSVKKAIELGGGGCNINITPINNDIMLEATDEIDIKPEVTITATPGHSVVLKIVPCPH